MMLALKSGPQIAAKVGNPAGLLCQRIWYSVGKSGVLGITEYRQGRPLVEHVTELYHDERGDPPDGLNMSLNCIMMREVIHQMG